MLPNTSLTDVRLSAAGLPEGFELIEAAGIARSQAMLQKRLDRMGSSQAQIVSADKVKVEWHIAGGPRMGWGDDYRVGKWVAIRPVTPKWQSLLDNPDRTMRALGVPLEHRENTHLHVNDETPESPFICVNGPMNFGISFDPTSLELTSAPFCICAARSDQDCCCTLPSGEGVPTLPAVCVETWECRSCGDRHPCQIKIRHAPTDYRGLGHQGRLASPRQCVCGVPKKADFVRVEEADDCAGLTVRGWTTIRS